MSPIGCQLRPVRPSDAAALAHILVTANEHTFRGIVPDQCLEFTEAQSAANWHRSLTAGIPREDFFVLIERAGHQPVGYVWARPSDDADYRAELRHLNIVPAHQRQGIGRLLVREAVVHLAALGIHSLSVETLRCNPNRAFYERLGAQYLSERPHDWDGVIMPMCRYGWADTRLLQVSRTVSNTSVANNPPLH
jgi:ribosomal protein S18 acetylase RimI-like enzyme